MNKEQRTQGDCLQWKANGQYDINKRRKVSPSNPSPNSFMQQNERREPEVPEEKSPSGRMSRWPCKDYLKGTCTNSLCKRWQNKNACSTRPRVVVGFGKSARMHIVRLMNKLACKRSKRMMTKVAVAMGSSSNYFLLARKKSDFCWFLLRLRQPSYGTQSSRGGFKWSAGHAPSRFSGLERRRTANPSNHVCQGRPHSIAVGASRISAVRRPVHPLQRSSPVAHQRWSLPMQWPMSTGWRRRSQSLAGTMCTRRETKVPPTSERVEACKTFVERAKKRVQRVQEVMDKALAQRIVHEEEVAEGERRLALLQERPQYPVPQVTQLGQWVGNGPPSAENIPPMPTNPQDLEVAQRQKLRAPECDGVWRRWSGALIGGLVGTQPNWGWVVTTMCPWTGNPGLL